MSHQTSSAVLVIVFNRADCSGAVLRAVGAARPARMYLAGDGARPHVPGEAELCEQTWQAALRTIDWPCELHTLRAVENLGTARRSVSAFDWFFEQEERGIFFDDDCVPHPDFFTFCDELLERYADDERVATISGNQFVPGGWPCGGASYSFVRLAQIWGWATWRRAWKNFDFEMKTWPAERAAGLLARTFPKRRDRRYWAGMFDHIAQIKTWDYQWCFMRWRLAQAGIAPGRNLVTNIGFRPDATNTLQLDHPAANVPLASLEFPLRHPGAFQLDNALDEQTARILFSHGGFPAWWKYQREQRLARWFPRIFGR